MVRRIPTESYRCRPGVYVNVAQCAASQRRSRVAGWAPRKYLNRVSGIFPDFDFASAGLKTELEVGEPVLDVPNLYDFPAGEGSLDVDFVAKSYS